MVNIHVQGGGGGIHYLGQVGLGAYMVNIHVKGVGIHFLGQVRLGAYMVNIHEQVEMYGGRGIHYLGQVRLGAYMVVRQLLQSATPPSLRNLPNSRQGHPWLHLPPSPTGYQNRFKQCSTRSNFYSTIGID